MTNTGSRPPAARRRMSPKAIAAVALLVLALVLVVQNAETGRLNVLFWELRLPTWVWLLLVFASGLVVGSIFPWLRRPRR